MDRKFAIPTFGLALLMASASPAEASGPDDPPDLSGSWAQKVVLTSVSDPPVVGRVTSQTTTYLRYEIRQDDRELAVETETCDVVLESESSAIRTVLPDRFVRALPDRVRSARLVASDGEEVFRIDRSYSVLGAELREPTSEFLPEAPDDPRVLDADGDGEPGATVRVRGLVSGDMYVVQRAWDRYRGVVRSTRRVTGRVDWKVEQKILEATSVFLQSQPPTRPHPDDSKSGFEMVRVSSDTTCDDVLDRRDQLFEAL